MRRTAENSCHACYVRLNMAEMSDWERTVAVAAGTFARLTIRANNAWMSRRVGLEEMFGGASGLERAVAAIWTPE